MAAGMEQFRKLFAEEATTRLSRLSEQLLQLESRGSDPELVTSIFRDAHTLKGGSAMVGLPDVRRVAHAMEEVLEPIRSGDRTADAALIDALLAAVDGIRDLVPLTVAGGDGSAIAEVLEATLLDAAAGARKPTSPPAPTSTSAPAPDPGPAPTPAAPVGDATLRVPVERVDELVRLVGEAAAGVLRVGRLLTERLDVDAFSLSELRDLSRVINTLQERTMRARMVPVATMVEPLHRAVRDAARATGKEVRWEARGTDTELDRNVLEQIADPLMHLVRNAVDHGLELPAERVAAGKPAAGVVRFHAMQLGSEVIVAISDDGRGIDVERVRAKAITAGRAGAGDLSDEDALDLIFAPGLSTADEVSELSGRGVGLDVVRTNLDALRGRVEVRTTPGQGSEFRVRVPITLAVLPCLLVSAADQAYAIPMHSVSIALAGRDIESATVAGRPVLVLDGEPVPLSSLAATLGTGPATEGPAVVLTGLATRHAFQVDELLGQRDVVVKGLGRLVPRLPSVAGASVETDGSILLVLDPVGVVDHARHTRPPAAAASGSAMPADNVPAPERGTVLVVDDALTVRELQRSILERAGYTVLTAGDGLEALARLADTEVDIVLTDVEMPNMDGFALTEAIRSRPALAGLPVVILTSRSSDEDRRRGLEAGADAYVVKSAFDQVGLIDAVERLLGTGTR